MFLFEHRQPANFLWISRPGVSVCHWERDACECIEGRVLHMCLAYVCLVKGRGRQVKREMEKERDMSQHPQDVSSFWAAVVWELEAALRRPVNSFSHRSPRACKTGSGCPLSLATLFRPFLSLCITDASLFSPLSLWSRVYSNQFQAIKRIALSNSYNTHKHNMQQVRQFYGKEHFKGRPIKKRKCIVDFFSQTRLTVYHQMHQFPCTEK